MRFIAAFFLFFICCSVSYGQSRETINLHFSCDSDRIDMSDGGNFVAIEQLRQAMTRVNSCDSIAIEVVYVESASSPEGKSSYNINLTNMRLESTLNLLKQEDIAIPDSLIFARCEGVGWGELHERVSISNMPYRDDVLHILDDPALPVSARQSALRTLHNGEAYSLLAKDIFPQLRRSSITIIYKHIPSLQAIEPAVTEAVEPAVAEVVELKESCDVRDSDTKPLFAVKSNLLFDVMSLINVEIEVPIRQRWSIAAELIFPWWVWDNDLADSRRNRIQLINGVVEGRYWWGDRAERPLLAGWFTGLYAGGGLYDFEHRAEGYQGEFFIAAGLSGGYSHIIGRARKLRLEYSLGVGLLRTYYRHYEAEFCDNEVWHAVETHRGTYSWFGPTRAKISLSWLLNYKRRVARD